MPVAATLYDVVSTHLNSAPKHKAAMEGLANTDSISIQPIPLPESFVQILENKTLSTNQTYTTGSTDTHAKNTPKSRLNEKLNYLQENSIMYQKRKPDNKERKIKPNQSLFNVKHQIF